ncbi:MAG: hypothetical protein M1822_002692 [Bathelium mastoideum]|nr:MAG: hypothetical protein M1822_002692 [Bathelium mastoideum]
MARRKSKKRSLVSSQNAQANNAKKPGDRTPRSMVIRIGAGEVGPSISQLVKDVREMMEPHTASRLKERRYNRLRDYTSMCGPLGVTHLLLFSRSEKGNVNLRLAITPRGPTLQFRVDRYSLSKDIMKAQKHPKTGMQLHQTPPLLVMNNFLSQSSPTDTLPKPIPKHLEQLSTTVFQSLFPPISPQTTPLSSIRRILLVNRETEPTDSSDEQSENGTYRLTLRHYAITTRSTSLSKPLRRLEQATAATTSRSRKKALPNLGKLDDVADYLLDPKAGNYTSGSESEVETDAEVEVLHEGARKVIPRRMEKPIATGLNAEGAGAGGEEAQRRKGHGVRTVAGERRVEKKAVKLVELGPRLSLRLTKVEEGLCSGKVMWHESIQKTKEEVKEMDKVWEERKREKERRKKEQRENVERKRREKVEKGGKADGEGEENEELDDEDIEDWDMDDDEWYEDDFDEDGANGGVEID